MIAITPYSVFMGVLITNILMILFIFSSRSKVLIEKCTPKVFIVLFLVIAVRMITPIEVPSFSKAINSYYIFPTIEQLLQNKISIFFIDPTLIQLILFCWFAGTVIALIIYIKKYWIIYYHVRRLPSVKDGYIEKAILKVLEENKTIPNIKVIKNKAITSPFSFGFFTSIILLPNIDYELEDLYFILLHEVNHFYIKSSWIKLLMCFISSIFWWNPMVKVFEQCLHKLDEIYCDRCVTEDMDDSTKIQYLETLIKMRKNNISLPKHYQLINEFSSDRHLKSFTIQRLELVISTPYKSKNFLILCSIIILIGMTFSFTYIFQPAYNPVAEELALSNFNNRNAYILQEGEEYVLYYDGHAYMVLPDITKSFESLPVYSISK